MEKIKTISAAEARQHFAELTDEVRVKGVIYLITRHGKEVARLIPPQAPVDETSDNRFTVAVKQFVDEYDDALAELADRKT